MKSVYREHRHFFKIAEHLTVTQRQTVEYAAAYLGIAFGYVLTCLCAILLYGSLHVGRIGKHLVVGVYDALKGSSLHCVCQQHTIVRRSLVAPLLAAALKQPHAADILKEACSAFHSALIGEVQFIAASVNYGVLGLNAHKAPCAAAEIGKLLVGSRYGSHGTCRVMTCNGYHRHGAKPCHLLHLISEHAYLVAGNNHLAKLAARKFETLEQHLFELFRNRIEHLAC